MLSFRWKYVAALLTLDDGVVAATVEKYAHGAIAATVNLVSLNNDGQKRIISMFRRGIDVTWSAFRAI